MLNHITIMGRLTRDPELRYTQSGIPVASFTVAVDRDYTSGQNGERGTDFIDCVAWRQGGEFVSKYFAKGSMIVVSGRLESRKWQDRDGNNRTSWEINVDRSYFGESRRNDQGSGQYQQNAGGYGNAYGQQNGQRQDYGGGYGQQRYQQPRQYQPAGAGVNVYAGADMRELEGDDPDNPFVGQQQPQQYGGQQQGMWDDINDGELPF